MTLFEYGLVAHLVADWLLQNDWMARHKTRLAHPAAWLHGGIHGVLLGLILGWQAGLFLAAVHILVDTRLPLGWWQRVYRQTVDGNGGYVVSVWADQVLHIGCLCLVLVLRGEG